jgi:putative transposase
VAGKDERALEVGLFRYALIREAADLSLSGRERGRMVRALAGREHVGPDGRPIVVGRSTLDDWIRAYRAGGFGVERDPQQALSRSCKRREGEVSRSPVALSKSISAGDGRSGCASGRRG